MSQPNVEIDGLTHRYGERVALDDVSFGVPPATMLALLGPNGGGKTTLFRILATLLTPSAGTARVGGADVVRQRSCVRAKIGVVFQKPSLDGKLTVAENLRHQGHLYGLRGALLKQRAGELLERFGVADRANDRADVLSGGLQRRVEVAKALLHEPEVLILDEPSTGLDPGARAVLIDSVIALRDQYGVTCLITTHLLDEASRCDKIAVLDLGKLVALDTPDALKSTIGGDVLTVTTADPELLAKKVGERFDCSPRVVDRVVHIERERGHTFVPDLIEAFPGEIDSVTVGKPTLDDVFFRLTGHRIWDDSDETSTRKKHGQSR